MLITHAFSDAAPERHARNGGSASQRPDGPFESCSLAFKHPVTVIQFSLKFQAYAGLCRLFKGPKGSVASGLFPTHQAWGENIRHQFGQVIKADMANENWSANLLRTPWCAEPPGMHPADKMSKRLSLLMPTSLPTTLSWMRTPTGRPQRLKISS